jgi:predicted DNA-binding transcriptional regulator YafY
MYSTIQNQVAFCTERSAIHFFVRKRIQQIHLTIVEKEPIIEWRLLSY